MGRQKPDGDKCLLPAGRVSPARGGAAEPTDLAVGRLGLTGPYTLNSATNTAPERAVQSSGPYQSVVMLQNSLMPCPDSSRP